MSQQSNILIVDDGVLGRTTLETLFRHSGHLLSFASNGPEALSMAAKVVPDVILLDVMMPDMDGFEVCRRLRDTPQLAEVPIILVTALDDRDSRLRGIEAGADDFISKPFDRIELRTRVQTITRLNRYRRLIAAREKFEWVVEEASDGYVIVRDDDSIAYANSQARRYLGLSSNTKDEIAHTFLWYARRMYKCEPEEIWGKWPDQDSNSTPIYLVLPETSTTAAFWLQVDRFEAASQGNNERIIRLQDVSQNMQIQRDMRSFHAMITHKLRTPLAGIFTSLELLEGNKTELSDTERSDVIEIATGSAKRLRNEIEDILQYIQVPTLARRGMGLSLSEICPLIKEIGSSLQLPAVAMAWQTGLDAALLPLTRRAAEVVFWEILENSKKFHPTNTPAIDVFAFQSQSEKMHILLRDDGVALSPTQIAHVWRPYYQGEKEFTGQLDGMGLGLSLVASIVWSVGGSCHFRNRVSQSGVEVELILPIT